MGLFSKKNKNVEQKSVESETIYDWNSNESNKIPKILPNTLMQRLAMQQNREENLIVPQKIFTDDIKAILKMRASVDEHKKFPEDMHNELKHKIEKQETEKVIVLKEPKAEQTIEMSAPPKEILKDLDKIEETKSEHKESNYHSFFAQLAHLFSHKHGMKHAISQDMMQKLKEYHDSIGKGDSFFMHEVDIEREIERSLDSLKEMETEWLLTKKGVASAERMLYAKEEELERKLGEFRNLLQSADRFRNFNVISPEGNSFLLSSGMRLHSIQHLLNELPHMSDDIFYMHVNDSKNDFASWIRDVFKLEDLSMQMSRAKSREEILEILKKY
jgi:hypothetical protein